MDNLFVADVSADSRCFAVSVNFAEISAFDTIEANSEFTGWEMFMLLHVDNTLDDLSCDETDVVA
jgi:hypothetical protein